MGDHAAALARFLASPASEGWRELPFFREGAASSVAAELDRRTAAGARILPAPDEMYAALELTRLRDVRAVIVGQDPYPTPGHAHGLAFSYRGAGPAPASLKRILREVEADLNAAPAFGFDLTPWARQGVLLINAALSVEAGRAGAHLRLGWEALADQVVRAVSRCTPATAFLLWGDKARSRRGLIDSHHLVIESAHPSPLAARGDFLGSRPFSRANAWLAAQGRGEIDWAGLSA